MYALTFIYEGVDDNNPFATTMAVSEDKDKLRATMKEHINNDLEIPENENDQWDDYANYQIYSEYDDEVILQHRKRVNLYIKYQIHPVVVL